MRSRIASEKLAVLGITLMLMIPLLCSASSIIYPVNRMVGTGTVTGFIETDGTLGVLSAANIVDWNISLDVGADHYDLFGPLSGNSSTAYVQGVDLTANPTQILFDFDGIDLGYFLLQFSVNVHDGFHYYCDANFHGLCLQGETDSPEYYTDGQTVDRSGNVVIAGSVTPEPGTWGLVLSGLGLLAPKRRILGILRTNRD